jgi:hypothetical protein
MSTTVPYHITNDSVTVVLSGKTYTVKRGDENFNKTRQAVLDEEWDSVPILVSKGLAMEQWTRGMFTFKDNHVFFQDEQLPEDINSRLLGMAKAGKDPSRLMRFWQRLQANPSYLSVRQLYNFLQNKHIPIGEDGSFLAYKSVRADYKDHYSGAFDNRPGKAHMMPRNKISDDPSVACHEGFHVGNLSYARGFRGGSRMVICKVDPADVVCVPNDSSHGKVRVCKYTVVGEHNGYPLPSDIWEEDILPPLDEEYLATLDKPYGEPEDEEEEVGTSTETVEDVPRSVDQYRADLRAMTLKKLREYAKEERGIKNVKAIKGGKEALIKLLISRGGWDALDPVEKWVPPPPSQEEDAPSPYDVIHKLSAAKLKEQPLGLLRKYARHKLKIVGASKLPGGKSALIERILQVRA